MVQGVASAAACLVISMVSVSGIACQPHTAVPAGPKARSFESPQRKVFFPYFQGNGESGVYLAVSEDGLRFRSANMGTPIFTPPQWPNQSLTRDPSIVFRGGLFHMVWTSNWSGRVMGYASSPDLVTWSEPLMIDPFPAHLEPENIWAPELDYDPARNDFFIVFSSTLPEELNDGDGSGDPHGNDHRPYIIRTPDFQTFSTPEVYIDPGYSAIDPDQWYDDRGTPDTADDRWVMVYKNEMGFGHDGIGKSLRFATRDRMMAEPWDVFPVPAVGPGSSVRANEAAEGPGLIRFNRTGWGDEWMLYWDSYGNGHYSLAVSDNLVDWQDLTGELLMVSGHPRHGTPFVVDARRVGVPMPSPDSIGSIPNGGFEEAEGGEPRGWEKQRWAGSPSYGYEAGGGLDGSACVRVSASGGGADAAWTVTAPVEPNTRYRLSGWIRTDDLRSRSGRGAQLNVHGIGDGVTPPVTGTRGWTRVQSEFDSGNRLELRVNCLLGGWGSSSGTAWFDNVVLEKLD